MLLLHYKMPMVFFTFSISNTFSKNMVLELWSKNLKTNQNAGFFKLQYLTKNLRCEVEFFVTTRGPRKH